MAMFRLNPEYWVPVGRSGEHGVIVDDYGVKTSFTLGSKFRIWRLFTL